MDTKSNPTLAGKLKAADPKMVSVKILRGTVAAGKTQAAGDIVDIPEREAKILLRLGKAEKASRAPKDPPKEAPKEPKEPAKPKEPKG